MESKSVCREIEFNLLSHLYSFLPLSDHQSMQLPYVLYILPASHFRGPESHFQRSFSLFSVEIGPNQFVTRNLGREREKERERESGLPPAPLAVKAFPSKAHFSAVAVNMSIDWGYYDSAEECTPTICAVIGEVRSQILALIIMCIAKQLSIQLTLVNGELEIDCSMQSIFSRSGSVFIHTKSV